MSGDPRSARQHSVPALALRSAHVDAAFLRRLFFTAFPVALLHTALKHVGVTRWVGFFGSLVLSIVLSVAVAFLPLVISLPSVTSRLASLATLGAGACVVNLNCARPPRVRIYEDHNEPTSRILRLALAMLGMEAEIRSCPTPTPGVPSPWREELCQMLEEAEADDDEKEEEKEQKQLDARLPLPYLVGLDEPCVASSQGDGIALAKALMQLYALDPKEVFPIDLSAKVLRLLATAAGYVRSNIAWGKRAHAIDWSCVNHARNFSHRATEPAVSQTPSLETNENDAASAAPSDAHARPNAGPTGLDLSSLDSPSASALKLRAQMQRMATARGLSTRALTSTAAHNFVDDEEDDPTPLSSLAQLEPLKIYGTEFSAECRLLFEVCASLQLPYLLVTCAQGSLHRAQAMLEYKEDFQLPILHDPNTKRIIKGGALCAEYIFETYASVGDK